MITNEELISILNKYSLGQLISSIEQITDGWTNLTYKFQVKSNNHTNNYILREYILNSQRLIQFDDIQFELNFISYLFQQYHLPVVPKLDPPGMFCLNNGNYAVIFPFIEGIKYINTPDNPCREFWQTIEISRFLGRMHSIDQQKISSKFNRQTFNFVDTKYQLLNSCQNFENTCPDLYQRIRQIIDQHTNLIPIIENENEQIEFIINFERNLPKGFIHMDIHDENVLFHPNEKQLAAVLDFDDMSLGPFLIDIAMTLCFWCLNGSEFRFDYAKEFLIEYQKTRGMLLTNAEWNFFELYCYLTIFHQILFSIQSRDKRNGADQMIEELLLPIEQISQNKSFLKNIQ